MNLNDLLKKLIEGKYNELAKFKENGIFEKINEFQGNAVGQIGKNLPSQNAQILSLLYKIQSRLKILKID